MLIDFFLIRRVVRGSYINCNVLLGESVVSQYGLLVLDVWIRRKLGKIKCKLDLRVKSRQLKESRSLYKSSCT